MISFAAAVSSFPSSSVFPQPTLPGALTALYLSIRRRDLASLIQLLDQLDGYALQTQRAITIPLLKSMLEDL